MKWPCAYILFDFILKQIAAPELAGNLYQFVVFHGVKLGECFEL